MIDFSSFFHQSSKDHRQEGAINIPKDSTDWPAEWKTVFYKTYPRFEKIVLPETKHSADFYDLLRKRRSQRDFIRTAIDIEAISTILKNSCGVINTGKEGHSRAQASGGARFPIEVYPIVLRGTEKLPSGLYHYGVRDHVLDTLWRRTFTDEDIAQLFTYEWVQNASVVFVMTAVFSRNQMKYGERGYRYVLLEAGHIGQNMYLNAAALSLKCCALGGTIDSKLEKFLDIDGITESVVYAVAFG